MIERKNLNSQLHFNYSNIINIIENNKEKTILGIPFIDREKINEILKEGTFQIYRITAEEEYRIDILSYKFYNRTDYDWIICYINNIKDPIKELKKEKEIIVPDLETVQKIYTTTKKELFEITIRR